MSEHTAAPTSPPTSPRPISGEQRALALQAVNRSNRPWIVFWEWLKSFCIAIVLFLFVRAFIVEAFKIPSGSMERTLLVGDFLLVNKLVYGAEIPGAGARLPALRRPQLGDVVVFEYPDDRTKNFVKRLVGMPGDTVEMREGLLWRNGSPQSEGYVTHTDPGADPGADDFRWQRDYLIRSAEARTHPSRNNWGPLIVPEGNYFVLGDNRDNSLDSRYWGFVPDSLVRGRPIFVYYSYAPDTAQPFAWLTRIRWDRIGSRVR